MTKKTRSPSEDRSAEREERIGQPFSRVVALVIALENYRQPSSGDPLPPVGFAHADADAFAGALTAIFKDLAEDDLVIEIVKDAAASLTAVRDLLGYTIKNLSSDDLFIVYYAGHGFHGADGNRLSTYDTNRTNVGGTSLLMGEDLLKLVSESDCEHALVFVDACAEKFKEVVQSRDIIGDLNADEVEEFLDDGWYLGVFLSCSPGQKSYWSDVLGHGIWTHFLLEALSGRAENALSRGRWLTDYGLRDYLRSEVPRYITRELNIRGTQTPQAILSGSNSFRIRHVAETAGVPADEALAGIKLRNNSEFLEGSETGSIRRLPDFQPGFHKVPTQINDSAESWCHRMLTDRVAEELQDLYTNARSVLGARRKDLRKESDGGSGDLDAPAFRYSVETGQNPDDPAEFIIRRRLELRQGWQDHRAAIDELFQNQFDRLVVSFESMNETFDDLVDRLEDIKDDQGGDIHDDDRGQRVSYARDGVTFTFDLKKRRLEISFGGAVALELIDAAQKFQLGIENPSPMLTAAQAKSSTSGKDKGSRGRP